MAVQRHLELCVCYQVSFGLEGRYSHMFMRYYIESLLTWFYIVVQHVFCGSTQAMAMG